MHGLRDHGADGVCDRPGRDRREWKVDWMRDLLLIGALREHVVRGWLVDLDRARHAPSAGLHVLADRRAAGRRAAVRARGGATRVDAERRLAVNARVP